MSSGDVAAISRVHRAACLIAYRFMAWDHPLEEIEPWYAGKFPGWDFARVATVEDRVVGYLGATGGMIDDLFITPAFQSRGIGRTLLAAQLARGIRPVDLEVFAENLPARRLYEAFGFVEMARFWTATDGAMELRCRLGREGSRPWGQAHHVGSAAMQSKQKTVAVIQKLRTISATCSDGSP